MLFLKLQTQLNDNEFDLVVILSVINQIPIWKEAINEVKRVLKPNTELILKEASIETFSTIFGRI